MNIVSAQALTLSSIAFSSTPRFAVCMKKEERRRYPSLQVEVSPLRRKRQREVAVER
jgi:hypothetical protein